MRISPIHNITFKSNNEIKQSKPSDNEKGLNNSAKLALGVSGGAALGFAAYFLFRGKPVEKNNSQAVKQAEDAITQTLSKVKSDIEDLSSKLVIKLKNGGTKVQFSTPVKEDADALRDIFIFDKFGNLEQRVVSKFDASSKETIHSIFKGDACQIIDKPDELDRAFLVKEIKIENFKPFMDDRFERNTIIKYADNTVTQYQDFYRKGKLYERYVYNNYEGKLSDTDKVTRYNFAYDNNGNFAAAAKQDILKDGHQHGIYSDKGFDPFPIYIKKNGEKDFQELKDIYTFEPLCKHDKRFNPDNL